LFINQFRSKIGGWSPTGDPLTEPGGKGLGFAYSLEITMKNKEAKGKDEYDVDTIIHNEHAFAITKNKLNAGPREGEFQVCRIANAERGLGIGDVDDAGTMLAYAKKFGAYTGGGSSWTLDFWDEEHKVRGGDEGMLLLYENPDLYWKLRNFLICEQATHLGMPDSFLERFYP
jgi:RecA/RadA recombinase